MNVYAARRQQLMEKMGPRAVAIIGGKKLSVRNSDVEHRFRQSSDLWYLTGFTEPEALAVIAPGRAEKLTLFVRPRDPERETWTGRRAGVEGAKAKFGADQSFPIDSLASELPKLLDGADEILYVPGEEAELDELVLSTMAQLRHAERRGMRAPRRIADLRSTLHELRLIKDADALSKMRRAADVTHKAHVAAMRAARDGVKEYEIEALIDYTFRKHGGHPGYGTIVGGGVNATILHYVDNTEPLKKGELLLIDAGCEVDGFTADVTRTYPIGAKFSPPQRRCYELVLAVEKACVAAVEPGNDIDAIHDDAVELLTRGMIELGLLRGDLSELIDTAAYKRFYMHRTSHWLGMDVHDVGIYAPEGKPRPLQPGMVLTIEPGLYIAEDANDVAAEYRGIGIRVEDDILVTADGHENLTIAIPKEIADVEALTTA
ncbi:MAG: aminopeptidase P N-terminal domain-containing protein [Myxococcales bacterium]|nr:aminopeptidase P N-terminal domain-containing protein [Myxococcales bacterium]